MEEPIVPPWEDKTRNPEWLRYQYHHLGKNIREVADETDSSPTTIRRRFGDYNIKTRTQGGYDKDAEWRDEDTLRTLYKEQGMSIDRIADKFDVGSTAIRKELVDSGIERRTFRGDRLPHFRTDEQGYENWYTQYNGGKNHVVRVHRLLATLMVDNISDLEGMHVHHSTNIPWMNMEDELEIMTPSEHSIHHNSG